MNENISKPITVARDDFMSELTALINNSGLPPFILESIFKEYLSDIRLMSKRQLEADRKRYQEMLKNLDNDEEAGD